MKNVIIKTVLCSLVGFSAQALEVQELKSCLKSDIEKLKTSRTADELTINSSFSATAMYKILTSPKLGNLQENLSESDAQIADRELMTIRSIVKASKNCSEVQQKLMEATNAQSELDKNLAEDMKHYTNNQKEVIKLLTKSGLETAAQTMTGAEVMILSQLQQDMIVEMLGQKDGEDIYSIVQDSLIAPFNDAQDQAAQNLEKGMSLLIKELGSKNHKDYLAQLRPLLERQQNEINAARELLEIKIAALTAQEVEQILIQRSIQSILENWQK